MTISENSFLALIVCIVSCMLLVSFTIYKLYEIQTNSYKYIKSIILLNAERGISLNSNKVIFPKDPNAKPTKSEAYNPKNDILAHMGGKIVDVYDS